MTDKELAAKKLGDRPASEMTIRQLFRGLIIISHDDPNEILDVSALLELLVEGEHE